MEIRIIERTYPDGRVEYTIQKRHGIFRWAWVDVYLESWKGSNCQGTPPTLRYVQLRLFFDSSYGYQKLVF